MKLIAFTIALAGTVSAASINAQTIIPTRLPAQSRNCTYVRSTNSVGDIIFGRANNTVCTDVRTREDGAWYQVGRGPNNNSIYERRVRDANGNLVIQRARRSPTGTFTVFNTRVATANDKAYKNALKAQRKAYQKAEKAEDKEMKASLKAGTISKDQYKDYKRADKAQDKAEKAQLKTQVKANHR